MTVDADTAALRRLLEFVGGPSCDAAGCEANTCTLLWTDAGWMTYCALHTLEALEATP